jgi:hypothetical protein
MSPTPSTGRRCCPAPEAVTPVRQLFDRRGGVRRIGRAPMIHPKRMMLGRRGFGTVVAHASVRDLVPPDM